MMSKMSELDADRQQIERLTDVIPPPTFAKSAAYTPGPWEIREIAHEATPFGPRRVYRVEIGSPIIDRASKHRYGTRRVCQITDFADFIHDTANARLIAALPDLVDALHEAREFIDGQIDVVDGSYGEPAPNRAMSLAQAIDAALAKAGAA